MTVTRQAAMYVYPNSEARSCNDCSVEKYEVLHILSVCVCVCVCV